MMIILGVLCSEIAHAILNTIVEIFEPVVLTSVLGIRLNDISDKVNYSTKLSRQAYNI